MRKDFIAGWRLAVLCIALALAVSGCAVEHPARDAEALKSNQGVLAFHVVSNADAFLNYGEYASESTFGSRFGEEIMGPKGTVRIKAGKSYHVVPIDAGDYMFTKLSVYPRFSWLQSSNRFKVTANSITYIGHIHVDVAETRFGLKALDQELDMRTYLADAYPAYFKSMDLKKSVVQLHLR